MTEQTTELDEVGQRFWERFRPYVLTIETYSDALRMIRQMMPDESETVISGAAWSLYTLATDEKRKQL
jgi:hypothetical protein